MTLYRSPLPQLTIDDASPDAAALLEDARRSLGFVPNMYAVMANSPGLLATYLDGYGRFQADSGFSPAEQEVVFLAISRFNECTYCVAAHSVIGERRSHTPTEVIDAIRDDAPIPDARLAALATLTVTMMATGGRPSTEDVAAFRDVGFTDRQLLEVILAIAVKTISNWTNHVFDTAVDDAFSSRRWTAPGTA